MALPPFPAPLPPARRHRFGGGVFIAVGALLGAFAGGSRDEPVIGLLAGVGIGIVLAVLVWIVNSRRR